MDQPSLAERSLIQPMTLEELYLLHDQTKEAICGAEVRALPQEERDIRRQELLSFYIQRLVDMRERFKHVFKTGNGSVYFALQDGALSRIKVAEPETEFAIQPISLDYFFVSSQVHARLLRLRREHVDWQEMILNMDIPIVNLTSGVHPLDFGIQGSPIIRYNVSDGILRIHGDEMGIFASGFHQGNEVTEILK